MWVGRLLLAVLALGAFVVPARAQQVDSLRQKYRLPPLPEQRIPMAVPRIAPSSSAGSPTAFGASWGEGFIGIGFQSRTRFSHDEDVLDRVDGTAVVGFGLGDARELVGLGLALTSFSTVRSGFFDVVGVSFKIHRILPNKIGVAFGWENALDLDEGGDGGSSMYGVVSKVFTLSEVGTSFSTLTVSAGLGNGRFRFESDVLADEETVNVFGSVGLRVLEAVGVIADWTGQDLALAVSVVPFRGIPLVITPGVADVIGTAGDGARFTLGAGLAVDFADVGALFWEEPQ